MTVIHHVVKKCIRSVIVMSFDFKSIRMSLKISQEQFNRLDELDGNKDGKVSESVFDMASKIRNKEEIDIDKVELKDKVKDILKDSETTWLEPKFGEAQCSGVSIRRDFFIKGDKEKMKKALNDATLCVGSYGQLCRDNDVKKNVLLFDGVQKYADALIGYYLKNGTTEGFEFYGEIDGKLQIKQAPVVEYSYERGENDSSGISEGIAKNIKRADSIYVTIITTDGNCDYKTVVVQPLDFSGM